jgi:hypothetical protein
LRSCRALLLPLLPRPTRLRLLFLSLLPPTALRQPHWHSSAAGLILLLARILRASHPAILWRILVTGQFEVADHAVVRFLLGRLL